MSWSEIIQLMREGESQTVEFIRRIKNSDQLGKIITAFANYKGGSLILGLDDKNGHLIGEDITKDWIEDVCHKCTPIPRINVSEVQRAGKTLFLIKIMEGNQKPYSYKGANYIREGTAVYISTANAIGNITAQSSDTNDDINKRQTDAIAFLRMNKFITNRDYRELNKVSHKTSHIELVELVDKNLILPRGKGRSTGYILV
jgi:predicted HTH transcriptional regulator